VTEGPAHAAAPPASPGTGQPTPRAAGTRLRTALAWTPLLLACVVAVAGVLLVLDGTRGHDTVPDAAAADRSVDPAGDGLAATFAFVIAPRRVTADPVPAATATGTAAPRRSTHTAGGTTSATPGTSATTRHGGSTPRPTPTAATTGTAAPAPGPGASTTTGNGANGNGNGGGNGNGKGNGGSGTSGVADATVTVPGVGTVDANTTIDGAVGSATNSVSGAAGSVTPGGSSATPRRGLLDTLSAG
jgi:hypothetical protein